MKNVGLIGYGRAGKAVARVLNADAAVNLKWVAHRNNENLTFTESYPVLTIRSAADFEILFNNHPVDYVIDFSSPDNIMLYGRAAAAAGIHILSANSNHDEAQLAFAQSLADQIVVMCSPNITVGINFLMIAAKALQKIAPHVDIAVLEEHFKEKKDISGTAKKLAHELNVGDVTSLRLGGIVGHHQVVFGFPYQTVRFIHDSISREAFGTGAIYALSLMAKQPPGMYEFASLMRQEVMSTLLEAS
ncbi:dihydrodipicolinate reductase C-terminal domain-containing protein [Chitinibacter sp. FCG-7]|uniref:4-hydroxy-tetrahydrodipicolinate reductase n=1 Tax=Chitinibacter mangrovi TaxID=3153927 RepID=A0AAU7FE47_9NEIS